MQGLADFLGALSDETRLRIIVLLAQSELYVCQICGILGLPQPKVSKHLSKLRDMGYVSDRRSDKYVLYSLNISNEAEKEIVASILKNIERYPQLCSDREGLSRKESYICCCGPGRGSSRTHGKRTRG